MSVCVIKFYNDKEQVLIYSKWMPYEKIINLIRLKQKNN